MPISEIVDVVITRTDKPISRAGFGTPLIFGIHTRFAERINFYSSIEEMEDAGFISSDAEHKAATRIFAQDLSPEQIAIGRRTANVAQIDQVNVAVITNVTLYTVTINGVACDYTSDGSATAAEIRDGLISAINGSTQAPYVTAATVDGDTLSITSDTAGLPFTLAVTATILTITNGTANVNVATQLAIVRDSGETGDSWFGLILTSRVKMDILQAAEYIETLDKVFLGCSEDADLLTSATDDVASQLQDAEYDHSGLLYSGDQEHYPEAGLLGLQLAKDPGSSTYDGKSIEGITRDFLNTTQKTNLETKNASYYETIAGLGYTRNVKVASGEWFDVTVGLMWYKSRLQEEIFLCIAEAEKIPFTDGGIDMIIARIRAVNQEAIKQGVLSDGEGESPVVTYPKAADVSTDDKTNRILPDVEISGTLAGAIHKAQVRVKISV